MNDGFFNASRFRATALIALSLSAMTAVFAAVATTTGNPVGFTTVALLANSDTLVSVPFQRSAAYAGAVATVSGSVVTLAGQPGWTTDQLVYHIGTQPNTYYVIFRSGAKEGHAYLVTTNSVASITLDLSHDNLAGVGAGDGLSVVPFWTLGTVFPAGSVDVQFTESPGAAAEETRILMLPPLGTGINPMPAASFVFSGGAWKAVGATSGVSKNDEIIPPDTYFIVRNAGHRGTLVTAGTVVMHRTVSLLIGQTNTAVDNPIAPSRPIPVSLNDSGLISSGAFASSPNALQRTDVLVVFDNSAPSLNRPAVDYYIFYDQGWRKIGQPLTQDFGNDLVFGPGKAAFIRKAPNAGASIVVWINTPTYSP